jgi:hypothetical protein
MSEVVEIKTGTEVSEVVEELAKTMGDETLCLPVPKSVAEGEWVRFSIQLEDGTHVIEGVGKCAGAIPRGNPTDRYELHLAELSFDERNEIMYERMLIAKDAAKQGDDTGTIKLEDVAMEVLEGQDEVSESSPPPRSVPPPPPAKSAAADAKKTESKASTPPAKSTASKSSLPKAAPKPSLMKSPLGKKSTPPAKRASTPPSKRASTPPSKRASTPPSAQSDATKVDLEAPKKARASVRPSRRPPAVSDGPFTLEIPYELVAKARKLEDRLPRKLFDRDRTPKKPEAAVLLTALRVGLGALEGAADDD